MKFEVYDARAVQLIRPTDYWAVISIVSGGCAWPEIPVNPWFRGRLNLVFEDVGQDGASAAASGFTTEHAERILDFYTEMRPRIELLVIHCLVGISRSPAVAAALTTLEGEVDVHWFYQKRPNRLVYRTLLEQAERRGLWQRTLRGVDGEALTAADSTAGPAFGAASASSLPPCPRRAATSARIDRFQGGLVGSAIGDAVGELAFGALSAEHLEECIGNGTLHYTDDTAMALAIAEVLERDGDLGAERLGAAFATRYRQEPWRGYGPGAPSIFRTVQDTGCSFEEAARRSYGGQGSFGNGAAMRVAPVGLFYAGSSELEAKARLSALPTHAHPVAADGAAVLAWAIGTVSRLGAGQPLLRDALLDGMAAVAQTALFRNQLAALARHLAAASPPETAILELGWSQRADESVPFALFAFFTHPDDFAACVHCAVLHGGDCDTLGAMAGALSGARLGHGALPRPWRDQLENATMIAQLASRLAALAPEP